MNLFAVALVAALAPEPPAEISTITIPIRSSLSALTPALEQQVPKTFSNRVVERGIAIRYDIVRDRIALRMIGNGLHATTTARYRLQACRGQLGCVSCGFNEPARLADIALHSRFRWNRNWQLEAVTRSRPAHFPNRCRITFLRFDVTNRFILPVVNDQLREMSRTIDRSTPQLTRIRPIAQQVWTALQAPAEIAPRTWLVFEPTEVSLGPVHGQGQQVASLLGMRARTRVLVGERPSPAIRPLPQLGAAVGTEGLRIPFDLHVPYAEASRLLSQEFGKREYRLSGATLRIENIRISPAAGGKVAVEALIDYRGGRLKRYAGPVNLEGTLQFDPATTSLVVEDLDYTLDPAHRTIFIRLAERVAHDDVRERLRAGARWPLSERLAAIGRNVERGLTRRLARGATMTGTIESLTPQHVSAGPDALAVRLVITGRAEVNVTEWK